MESRVHTSNPKGNQYVSATTSTALQPAYPSVDPMLGLLADHAATAEGMRRAVRAGVDTIEGGYYGNEMK